MGSTIRFKVNDAQFAKKLTDRFKVLQNDAVLKTRINQAIADKCDQYVPYQTGELANNVTVNEEGIKYNQPYASKQYYGEFNHNTSIHPLATGHWDKVMLQNNRDELNAEIRTIINDRMKELRNG